MTFLRRCLLVLLLIAAAPASAAGDAGWFYRGSDIQPDPAWTFGTLPNGMRYVVRRNPLPAGQVSIRLRINAGSLNETDEERGFAHFIEHMTFRGTKNFPDREARHIWQQLGASFGSDTNASTTATQTVYQLDLPKNDRQSLSTSLDVLAEMMDSARFDPATVDAERKVVLAEKGRRPALSNRMIETAWPLFYAGLKYADRDPIGTDATLNAASSEALRAFYERWYRPTQATLIMVGDADPAMMEALIAEHFAGWKGEGPAPAAPDYGRIITPKERSAAVTYPGAPHASQIIWLRPYAPEADTIQREKEDLATSLAARILNRRLEAKARGDAAFLTAAVGQDEMTDVADVTQLSITAKDGRWQEALNQSFAIIADALRAPPSEAEITREMSNLRTAAAAGVQADPTTLSQQRAQQMVGALDIGDVLATPQTIMTLIDALGREMTPALVEQAMKGLFAGAGPRLVQLAPNAISGADANAALTLAEAAKPADRGADRLVSLDRLPRLGAPGREVSRQRIDDLGVTIVRFANGATLLFKPTDFDKGSVAVETRFGGGRLAMPPATREPDWLSGIIGPSGLADLDLDSLERLTTGRRLGLSFGVDEDAFVLRGQTSGEELGDQLRLMATKLAYPRWDAPLLARYKSGALEAYDLSWSSASALAGREFAGFLRSGDARWAPTEREEVSAASLDAAKRFFDPLLAQGPLEVIMVGDTTLEAAIAAMRRTMAALPPRKPAPIDAAALAVKPPTPDPAPRIFTHRGDPNQAYAAIGWNTFGGTDRLLDRRALSVAANLFQVRLFDQLREAAGASYSPNAASTSSDDFRDWGIFYAASEIRPESADAFFRIARDIVADLAAKPVAADEFARAQNPIVSGIQRRVKTNGYWLDVMEGWTRHPELIDATRSYIADYSKMTAEDVRRAVATYVADAGDWSMLVVPAKDGGGGK